MGIHEPSKLHSPPPVTDWPPMQAYFGPVSPYFNPYIWGPPQHIMPPPYAAFYPHAGFPPNLVRETEGSSEGSDGNTTEGGQNGAKTSRERSPSRMTGVVAPSAKVLGSKVEGGGDISPNSITELNRKNIPSETANMTSPIVPLIPNESLLQNDQEVKRERRKQSNRDSARRSRLRKQAEAEELSIKVDALNSENLTLRSEINRLTDNSGKLKLQNAKLLEKLKKAQKEQVAEDLKLGSSLSTANLISRVDNSSDCLDVAMYESNGNQHPESGGKLRQLLNASPRADAVAAR